MSHSNMKGRRADSLLFHPVFFFPAGDEGGGWGEMHARKLVKFINSATQETSMRDWNPSLYFLEHPESQRVVLLVALSLGLGTRDILQSPSRLHVTEMMIPPSTPSLSSTYMDLGPGRGKGGVLGYWW